MARIRRAAQSAPQEVLVPEAEQPYAVPENWRWVRLGGICSFIGGGTPNQNIPEYWHGNNPWASVKDIKGKFLYNTLDSITESGLRNSSSNVCDLDDIIIVTRISPGNVAVAKTVLAVNQDLKIVKTQLNNLFLYYCFVCLKNEFIARSSGTTVLGITLSRVQEICVPLPPRAEQERIVARIESLFARLDKAREKVDAVLGRCAARKAALLHKAFSGELTAAWRKARGIGLESWEEKTLGDIIRVSSGKSLTIKKMVSNGDIPVYGGNGIAGYHNDYNVNGKVIVIGRVGFYCGSVHAIEGKAWVTDNALIVSAITNEKFEFLKVLLDFCNLGQYSRSTAQPVISGTTIYPIKIYLPSREEQAEIVRILDELLARERRAQEAAERVAARIEQIKRAVLTKAFRGELGTNDPAEPAALTEQGSLSLA